MWWTLISASSPMTGRMTVLEVPCLFEREMPEVSTPFFARSWVMKVP
jgi:hypothetical protein